MKSFKNLVLAKSIAAAAVALSGLSAPLAVQAAEDDGVTCPAGTEALFGSGNVLRCKKIKTLASICSPLAFGTKLTLGTQVVMEPAGSDTCRALVTGQVVASQMQPPTPGIDPPASAFARRINATLPDSFVAEQFVYPLGALYFGDAAQGVACPGGFTPVRINGERGLRCETREIKTAGCDFGWTVERHTGRDLCVTRDLFGNRVIGQYTIPLNANYVGLMGNPENNGWNLDQDRSGSIDSWLSENRTYRYPVVQ